MALNDYQRTIANKIEENFGNVTIHQNGNVTVKNSYFYRHNNSPEKLAKRVLKIAPACTVVSTKDEYRTWPKTSYFVVKVAIPKQPPQNK